MEIKKGDLRLKADTYNYWIEREQPIEKGKNKGTKAWTRITGYHANLPSLYKDFVETELRTSDANNMKKAIAKIHEAIEEVKNL